MDKLWAKKLKKIHFAGKKKQRKSMIDIVRLCPNYFCAEGGINTFIYN